MAGTPPPTPQNPALPGEPSLPKPAPSPPAPSSFLLLSLSFFFFILLAEHLPAGHSISFLVLGE